jgi:hypothetical protein
MSDPLGDFKKWSPDPNLLIALAAGYSLLSLLSLLALAPFFQLASQALARLSNMWIICPASSDIISFLGQRILHRSEECIKSTVYGELHCKRERQLLQVIYFLLWDAL